MDWMFIRIVGNHNQCMHESWLTTGSEPGKNTVLLLLFIVFSFIIIN